MTGVALIIAFVVAIVAMILLISKLKVHPFLAIMGISLVLAILAGIPLTSIPGVIGAGFSGTFSSIGIVIGRCAMYQFELRRIEHRDHMILEVVPETVEESAFLFFPPLLLQTPFSFDASAFLFFLAPYTAFLQVGRNGVKQVREKSHIWRYTERLFLVGD